MNDPLRKNEKSPASLEALSRAVVPHRRSSLFVLGGGLVLASWFKRPSMTNQPVANGE
jgi:hypothetical protein